MRLFLTQKTYTIDLNLPEQERWLEVMENERTVAKKLCREALRSLEDLPDIVRKISSSCYAAFGGRYVDEMAAWAEELREPLENVVVMQCSYEFAHLGNVLQRRRRKISRATGIDKLREAVERAREKARKILGCTAGIHYFRGHGMVHARSMDWPLKSCGAATRIFEFKKGRRRFVSVGMTGMVGVLSGMVPGAYSVTINWAEPD